MRAMTFRVPHTARAAGVAGAAIMALLLVSGCSEVKRVIGYDKAPPDEFAVLSRAPLSLPPDHTLRPPTPGAPRPQEGLTREKAQAALTGSKQLTPTTQIATSGRSSGDVALLKRAGADQANPEIRAVVNRETLMLAEADKSFTDRLVFWRDPPPIGEQVDAAKEAQRLRENQALGRDVGTGDTPAIARKRRGMLEGLW
jgi:hypothetical protein